MRVPASKYIQQPNLRGFLLLLETYGYKQAVWMMERSVEFQCAPPVMRSYVCRPGALRAQKGRCQLAAEQGEPP